MYKRRILAALGISAAALLGATGVASASNNVSTTGAHLFYYSSTNTFALKDTACDGHRVYGKWETNTGENGVVDNRSGCGSTVTKVINAPNNAVFHYWVCVDLSFSDRCSGQVRDTV